MRPYNIGLEIYHYTFDKGSARTEISDPLILWQNQYVNYIYPFVTGGWAACTYQVSAPSTRYNDSPANS